MPDRRNLAVGEVGGRGGGFAAGGEEHVVGGKGAGGAAVAGIAGQGDNLAAPAAPVDLAARPAATSTRRGSATSGTTPLLDDLG